MRTGVIDVLCSNMQIAREVLGLEKERGKEEINETAFN
jgi:hypothetical protein